MKTQLKYFLKVGVALPIVVIAITECQKSKDCGTSPTATTNSASFITQSGATINGKVNAYGKRTSVSFEVGETETYGQTIYISDQLVGIQPLDVHALLKGLSSGTTYHYRVNATGLCQVTYGRDYLFSTLKKGESGIIFNPDLIYDSVTDINGNSYKTIQIGTQMWMAENLKTNRFNDGTDISLVADNSAWANLKSSAYCWYNNDSSSYNLATGGLYNWPAVNTNKLCPKNWHVPTETEWTTLAIYLGGENVAGDKLKGTGTMFWRSPNSTATNKSGFTALPGGIRRGTNAYDIRFEDIGTSGYWWSSTETSTTEAWARYIYYSDGGLIKIANDKRTGNSVRCMKD